MQLPQPLLLNAAEFLRKLINLEDCYQGLWQYHQDPDEIFPEFDDTGALIRFLREHDYVMWPVDKC
jgi:hypothetical protein